MKNLLTITFIIVCANIYAQTFEIEKAYMNDFFKKNPDKKDLAIKFNSLLNKGLYPKLPYDSVTKKVEWKKTFKFSGMTKKQIFNRAKEWSARNFRSFDAVNDYENEESGKLMVKGYFHLPFSFKYTDIFFGSKTSSIVIKCYSIYVFTVVDGALKMEIVRPETEATTGGYSSGSTYIPLTTTRNDLISYFPIARMSENVWEGYMEFYRDMNDEYVATFQSVEKYILDFKSDYDFGK